MREEVRIMRNFIGEPTIPILIIDIILGR